jgi:abortive infection bacteriophage resistance protein
MDLKLRVRRGSNAISLIALLPRLTPKPRNGGGRYCIFNRLTPHRFSIRQAPLRESAWVCPHFWASSIGMAVYPKPYQTIPQMIATLQQRGMEIPDPAKASSCLERIGYYRLSGYWYPMRESQRVIQPDGSAKIKVLDQFRQGTDFSHIMDLYIFDKKLRLLLLDAIERIEVGIRVAIAIHLGAGDPLAHLNASKLDGKFCTVIRVNSGKTGHQEWTEKYKRQIRRSKEEFIKHFSQNYPNSELPIWIAIEVWDFGTLSFFLAGMKYADQRSIANKFGKIRPELLVSWVRAINGIRNACAHHSRVWNNPLVDVPKLPKSLKDDPLLHHVIGDRPAQTRSYAVAYSLQYLMRSVNPSSTWATRLKAHCKTFPANALIDLRQAGFPVGWEQLPLWI